MTNDDIVRKAAEAMREQANPLRANLSDHLLIQGAAYIDSLLQQLATLDEAHKNLLTMYERVRRERDVSNQQLAEAREENEAMRASLVHHLRSARGISRASRFWDNRMREGCDATIEFIAKGLGVDQAALKEQQHG